MLKLVVVRLKKCALRASVRHVVIYVTVSSLMGLKNERQVYLHYRLA